MKSVDSIARVRRAFYVQGWSLKRISRELHLSRNTNFRGGQLNSAVPLCDR